ncbi:MAG: ArnT family glycosyltransferase [Candidatus Binatia bacterium]
MVARRQWFVGDDFTFFTLMRLPINWLGVFLPLGRRMWWSYRPLTTDVFFSLGFRLFGYEPFGYLAVSLAAHFLAAPLVYRLARQLSFDSRVAIVAALLSVSRYPSLVQGFWISVVQYTVTMLFFLTCVSLFFDYAQSRRRRFLLGCCVALVLALLSNEVSATLPGVLLLVSLYVDRFALTAASLLRSLRRTVVPLVLVSAYLVLRIFLIGPGLQNPLYTVTLGWHVLSNYERDLLFVFDNQTARVLAAALLALAVLSIAVGSRRLGRPALAWLLRTNLLCLGWLSVVLVPYVGFGYPFPRFAIPAEVPACLLFASYLNVLSRLVRGKLSTAFDLGLIALVVGSIPYATLRERFQHPDGLSAKQFVELVQRSDPPLPRGATVVVAYGADGLVDSSRAADFSFRVGQGAALHTFFPDKRLKLLLLDLSQPTPKDLRCPPCLVLGLRPGPSGDIADYTVVRWPSGPPSTAGS